MLVSIGKRLRDKATSPRWHVCEHEANETDGISFACRQRVYVTCPHCQRALCLHHINEHQTSIRSVLDSLVDRLNDQLHELTVKLSIPAADQTRVNECLEEFRTVIVPYVQRTCCENDVKQDDVHRLQMFIDKMQTITQHIRSCSNVGKRKSNCDVSSVTQ